jgi:hypothetical protein
MDETMRERASTKQAQAYDGTVITTTQVSHRSREVPRSASLQETGCSSGIKAHSEHILMSLSASFAELWLQYRFGSSQAVARILGLARVLGSRHVTATTVESSSYINLCIYVLH